MPCHGSRHSIIECRPSTPGLELLVGGVKRGGASGAVVGPGGRGVLVVFACERRLCSLFPDDPELLYTSFSSASSHNPSISSPEVWGRRTRTQLRLPLTIALLHWIAHLPAVGRAEQCAQEGDRGHGNVPQSLRSTKTAGGEGSGSAMECGVAEGVECADEGCQGGAHEVGGICDW